MWRRSGLILIVALWLGLALPALAQSGTIRVEDPDGLLGSGADSVRAAAQPLANSGADVLVLVAGRSAGTSAASADQFLNTFLSSESLAPNFTQLQPTQIVFYVARDAKQTHLRFGQRWLDTLRPVASEIQAQQMNPRFASGDLAGGLVAGITAVNTRVNPPPSRVPYYVGGVVLVVALLAFVVPMFRRRQAASASLAGARAQAEQARRAAGVAIADLGQLAKTAEDKAQYDRISYSSADRERVEQLQSAGMARFREAQAAFDAAEEQLRAKASPAGADYAAAAARYGEAERQAQEAAEQIQAAEQLRAELDKRGAPSTGGTTRLEQ